MRNWRYILVLVFGILIHDFSEAASASARQYEDENFFEPVIEPERRPGESWEAALDRQMGAEEGRNFYAFSAGASARSSARAFQPGMDVSDLPLWRGNDEALLAAVNFARDERIYVQKDRKGFRRRTTWLYPRGGCYVRAAHIAQSMERQGYVRPGKVFAFGHLRLKTRFEPAGKAYWSYHVAAAYQYRGKAYVIDPSVSFRGILSLEDWIAAISPHPDQVKVSLCDTYAYSPSSKCMGGSRSRDAAMRRHLPTFLRLEWNNLASLRLPPEKLLGDSPPWTLK